jgi:AcrR family transcriptional regulator
VPKLWRESIELHRQDVRDAILEAAVGVVAERGPASVAMSDVAEAAGIGRATLYKYFPDVEAILAAWHERQVGEHLSQLAAARDRAGTARERLEAVLTTLAQILNESHRRHGAALGELAARLHGARHASHGADHQPHDRSAHSAHAGHHAGHVARTQRLVDFLRELLAEAAAGGEARGDVPPAELASYCVNALTGAGDLPSKAAVRRLVAITLDGLRGRQG